MKRVLIAISALAVSLMLAPAFNACTKPSNEVDNPGKDTPSQEDTTVVTPPADSTDTPAEPEPWFKTRGLCVGWSDVKKPDIIDYVELSSHGINTLSIYSYMDLTAFKKRCNENGIDIEYEEHALDKLLPQGIMLQHPDYFATNKDGSKNAGAPCASSPGALEEIKARVPAFVKKRMPDNHKYYFWLADGGDVCHCEKCKDYNASDQALIFENAIIEALREIDPEAQVAHLAYQSTFAAPTHVTPAEGVFLEFAPFWRNYTYPLSKSNVKGSTGITHGQYMTYLSGNLRVFPRETAQILEYWCDLSPYCEWSYDKLKKMPWRSEVLEDDLKTYAALGIRHIVSYAAFVGPDYVEKYGYPDFLVEYAEALRDFDPAQ